jgi:hypothetical protein
MKRYWKMFIALWPFYAILLLVLAIIWALKSPPPLPSSDPQHQTAKPVESVKTRNETPQEILKQCKIAVKLGDLGKYNNELRKLPADSQEYKEAREFYSDFKRNQAKREKQAELTRIASLKPKRIQFAKQYEQLMLEKGLDVYASAVGNNNTTFRIKFILTSRPLVYKLINDASFTGQLRDLGFKKFIMTDGYNDTWNADL